MEGNAKRRKITGDDGVAAAGSKLAQIRAAAVRLGLVAPPPLRHGGSAAAAANNSSNLPSGVPPSNQAGAAVQLGLVVRPPLRDEGSAAAANNTLPSEVQLSNSVPGVGSQARVHVLAPLPSYVLTSATWPLQLNVPPVLSAQGVAAGVRPHAAVPLLPRYMPTRPPQMGAPLPTTGIGMQPIRPSLGAQSNNLLVNRQLAQMAFDTLVKRTNLCNKLQKENERLHKKLQDAEHRVTVLEEQLVQECSAAGAPETLLAQPDGGNVSFKCEACGARPARTVLHLCTICVQRSSFDAPVQPVNAPRRNE